MQEIRVVTSRNHPEERKYQCTWPIGTPGLTEGTKEQHLAGEGTQIAEKILSLPSVTRVRLSSKMIWVWLDDPAKWNVIETDILQVLKESAPDREIKLEVN